jgi:hypothetical protein
MIGSDAVAARILRPRDRPEIRQERAAVLLVAALARTLANRKRHHPAKKARREPGLLLDRSSPSGPTVHYAFSASVVVPVAPAEDRFAKKKPGCPGFLLAALRAR